MKALFKKFKISIVHLECLDEIFMDHPIYKEIENKFNNELKKEIDDFSHELYAGGKQGRGNLILSRQMILGDVIEYIFTGRGYYYAAKSKERLANFAKLVLYCVNQLLIFDSITVNPKIRKKYIEELEKRISKNDLYEKSGDEAIAASLKVNDVKIFEKNWTPGIDLFVDSLLPKTLGAPKELVVFIELIKSNLGMIVPLLLIQRLFGKDNPIAPPDFLILKNNKEIYGVEVGYEKEGQSREFSIRSSIPTFAVDLDNNMHNRCPKCGEFILYCDKVIEKYCNDEFSKEKDKSRLPCKNCKDLKEGKCPYSIYYGKVYNAQEKSNMDDRHYHAKCVLNDKYKYRNKFVDIRNERKEFFAQVPHIVGIERLRE